MNNNLAFDSKTKYTGSASYVAYPSANQLFQNATTIGSQLLKKLPAYAAQVASANGNVTNARDIYRFFKIQWDLIFNRTSPSRRSCSNHRDTTTRSHTGVPCLLPGAVSTSLPPIQVPGPPSIQSTLCWTLICILRSKLLALSASLLRLSLWPVWLVRRLAPVCHLLRPMPRMRAGPPSSSRSVCDLW